MVSNQPFLSDICVCFEYDNLRVVKQFSIYFLLVVVFGSLAIGFAYLAYLLGGPIVQVGNSGFMYINLR